MDSLNTGSIKNKKKEPKYYNNFEFIFLKYTLNLAREQPTRSTLRMHKK